MSGLQENEIQQVVEEAFKQYDTDGSGFLERDEIRKLLNDACAAFGAQPIEDDQLDQVIAGIDENHDGKFSQDEMCQILKAISSQ